MKILQIVPEMKMGGVETGTLDLAKALVERGHQAFVISAGGPMVSDLERRGVWHLELPVCRKSPGTILRMSRRVRKFIRDEKIDIVHARSRVPAWIGFLAVRGTKARFLTTAHGYYRPHCFSRVMGWGERIIAISESIQEHLIQNFHVFPDRIRLIHRGVDLKNFSYREKLIHPHSLRIGILGRLTPLKGHEYFIKAFQKVRAVFPDAKGMVVGSAPPSKKSHEEFLIRLRDELGLKEAIEFISGTSQVAEILKTLDVLVLATTTPEGFGRVIIEAQAVGVPVVATAVGGVVDVIEHGRNGWLVTPGDSESLARTLLSVLQDSPLTLKNIREARRRVEERFTLDLMVEKTLEVYQELLKSPKILVIKWSALGDIILVSPSLRALRSAYPQGEISLLIDEAYGEIVQNSPYVDQKILIRRKKGGFRNFFRWLHEIRIRKFDVLIDFQNSEKSHLLGWLSQIPKRIGYGRRGRNFCLTHPLRYQPESGPVESQNRLLKFLNISMNDFHLEMWPSRPEEASVEKSLERQGVSSREKMVALFPFSNARWQTKQWGLNHFITLAECVSEKLKMIPVFIGGKEDALFKPILKDRLKIRYLDWIGEANMGELSELLKRCCVLVSGDSAPLHVGAASGTPVIAFFGPTDPRRHAPPGRVKILTQAVPCAPCYSPTCRIKTHDCLEEVTVEQVFNAIQEILKR
ncbi:MAG: glycosyltransferase [Chlamydiae bacterium]|nr:glycosyltransferase [Chlamydiota bacterium]MBI3265963.1 glycosyltransferase [Chlamydiota bacterium]